MGRGAASGRAAGLVRACSHRCVSTCPCGVQIPTLMRAFLYKDGYGHLYQARATVEDLPPHRGLAVCSKCPACTASCPNGIAIHRRLRSLMAMNLSETRVV